MLGTPEQRTTFFSFSFAFTSSQELLKQREPEIDLIRSSVEHTYLFANGVQNDSSTDNGICQSWEIMDMYQLSFLSTIQAWAGFSWEISYYTCSMSPFTMLSILSKEPILLGFCVISEHTRIRLDAMLVCLLDFGFRFDNLKKPIPLQADFELFFFL